MVGDASSATATLPPKINFIWVGGPIPQEYLQSIRRLAIAASKSNIEVTLWTNKLSNYEKTAEKLDQRMPANFRVADIQELKEEMQKDKFYQSKQRLERFWSYVNRELVGLKNYAAASDILRYEILRQQGGYYFDTDTKFELDEKSILKVDEAPYGFKKIGGVNEHLYDGNDIIGVVPHHPIMNKAVSIVLDEYEKLDQNVGKAGEKVASGPAKMRRSMDEKRSLKDHQYFGRRPLTLQASGPEVMRRAIADYADSTFPAPSSVGAAARAPQTLRQLAQQLKESKRSNPREKLYFNFRSSGKVNLLGIVAESHSAGSWLQPARPSSFDDATTFFSTAKTRALASKPKTPPAAAAQTGSKKLSR